MKLIYIIVCAVWFYNSFIGTKTSRVRSICEPMKIKTCKQLYNQTIFPNFHKHRSQNETEEFFKEHEFQTLLNSGCSTDLIYLVCSYFAPICVKYSINNGKFGPCRSLCKKVKKECGPTARKLYTKDLNLLRKLNCTKFPRQRGRKVCFGRAQIKKKNKSGMF
ncbi:frizzled-like [Dendronephthya gigantea]|uniref:frizzled-like n=1 Tax=Dendronephthya gigantea TaxID=151771 RepID=UPI00106B0BD6|nr:frizzled-like [Dendronephthya gigantea]